MISRDSECHQDEESRDNKKWHTSKKINLTDELMKKQSQNPPSDQIFVKVGNKKSKWKQSLIWIELVYKVCHRERSYPVESHYFVFFLFEVEKPWWLMIVVDKFSKFLFNISDYHWGVANLCKRKSTWKRKSWAKPTHILY